MVTRTFCHQHTNTFFIQIETFSAGAAVHRHKVRGAALLLRGQRTASQLAPLKIVGEDLWHRAALCILSYHLDRDKTSSFILYKWKWPNSRSCHLGHNKWNETLTAHVLSPVCQYHALHCTGSSVGGEDGTQAGLALLTVTAGVKAALWKTTNTFKKVQMNSVKDRNILMYLVEDLRIHHRAALWKCAVRSEEQGAPVFGIQLWEGTKMSS